jgi:hypothetical protein
MVIIAPQYADEMGWSGAPAVEVHHRGRGRCGGRMGLFRAQILRTNKKNTEKNSLLCAVFVEINTCSLLCDLIHLTC